MNAAEETGPEDETASKGSESRVTSGVRGVVLSGKQRRHLRALAHHLDPLVQLGKHGLTPGALRAIDDALVHHELIKVKLLTECPEDRDDVAERLAIDLKAHVAQIVGKTVLLYRRHPKKPVIQLPFA